MTTPLATLPAGPPAQSCCAPSVAPNPALEAERVAAVAKALAEPLRVRIVDVLRRSDTEVCQCELIALFEIKQSLLSHHMKKLADAGLVTVERRHRWAYYSAANDAFEELTSWLTSTRTAPSTTTRSPSNSSGSGASASTRSGRAASRAR
jgi:ArsR family transcriptional regulator